ncbi:MAG: hypothetical protein K5931_09125 [Lachnospiraceae bacterium]|nr:hypothetical protein [Lachnospiraceae bacterium]
MSNEQNLAEDLRKRYINNPPEGISISQIKTMSVDDLLDMHYFLTEEDDDDYGEDGFYIF